MPVESRYVAGKAILSLKLLGNVFGELILSNLEQPVNISSYDVTFVMSKLLRFRVVKDSQYANILHIFVTLAVLKLLRSRVVKDVQL